MSFVRNMYESDPNTPVSELAALVDYVRKTQKALRDLSDDVVLNADFQFLTPPFGTYHDNPNLTLTPDSRELLTVSPRYS